MADTDPIWPRTGLYIRRKNGDHFYAALLPDEATIALDAATLASKIGVFDKAIAYTDDGSLWLWDAESTDVEDGTNVIGSGERGRWLHNGGNATKLQGRNVSASAPGDNDALTWVAETQEWTPLPQSGGGGGDVGSAPSQDFIYDSGNTPAGNLYSDFDELYTAASVLPGQKRVHLVSHLTLPAASIYDWTDWAFIACGNFFQNLVQYAGRGINLNGSTVVVSQGTLELSNVALGGGTLTVGSGTYGNVIHARDVSFAGSSGTPVIMVSSSDALTMMVENCAFGADAVLVDGELNLVARHCDLSNTAALAGAGTVQLFLHDCALPPMSNACPYTGITISGGVSWASARAPVTSSYTLASSANNLSPYALGVLDVLRVTASSAGLSITGIAAPTAGSHKARFLLMNVGTTNSFTLAHQSASSTAANRFRCSGAAAVTVAPDSVREVVYDFVSACWRVT
jgi:hypothetical protein